MDTLVQAGDSLCRNVTAEEIAHYQQFGWVKLERFINSAATQELLRRARTQMGEDGDSNAPNNVSVDYFNMDTSGGMNDPFIRSLIENAGRNAKTLMARRALRGVRYYADFFAPKLPTSKSTSHAGNGKTDFHQDFISWGIDRSGGMTFWVALTDLTPESGTMSFVSGSHRQGALGHFATYGEGDLLDTFPEILDHCAITEPMAYAAGDVTVHSGLCVHGAGANQTDAPRWAYILIVNPSDARWTGAPQDAYSTDGLRMHEELDDARFPIVG